MSFIDKNPFNRPTPTFNTNSNTFNTYSTAFNTTYSNSPYNNYISDSNPYSYSNSHSTNAHLPYSKSSSYQYSSTNISLQFFTFLLQPTYFHFYTKTPLFFNCIYFLLKESLNKYFIQLCSKAV